MAEGEAAARQRAADLCRDLRARGDALSLAAAAEIEGTLSAFAGLVASMDGLRARARNAEANNLHTMGLWARVSADERSRVVHGPRR